jgi:hypothetical protein
MNRRGAEDAEKKRETKGLSGYGIKAARSARVS